MRACIVQRVELTLVVGQREALVTGDYGHHPTLGQIGGISHAVPTQLAFLGFVVRHEWLRLYRGVTPA
jgi:hypothetical protein